VASVRITGVQRREGRLERVEVEVSGGAARLRFAQAAAPGGKGMLGALVVDEVPAVVALGGSETDGALVLPPPAGSTLPSVPALIVGRDLEAMGEESVLGLAPLLAELADGLYTISLSSRGALHIATIGWTADVAGLVDLDIAARQGGAVVADLGAASAAVILAGRDQAKRRPPAWVITADVTLGAPGFEARLHDRGAREAFARAPGGALDDAALRDAVAHLRAVEPEVDLGPFTEDRIEPAAQQARALAWDLRAEDAIEEVSEPWRARVGSATEMRARVKVKSVTFEVAFVSHDGRRVDEVVVRTGGRFRATGLRPAARALARSLRQLADEGG
jgi:hypothetical protein